MATWNDSDIGKIIVYRNSRGTDEKTAICNFDKESDNLLEVLEYPISLKSKFYPVGLVKNQEVQGKDSLKNPGDWYLEGKVSSEEMSVLEKLANSSQDLLNTA